MSRPFLDVTVTIPDGQVFKGKGRNLPATIERLYNEGLKKSPKKQVTLQEQLKTGHVAKGERRYEGTFHATFSNFRDDQTLAKESAVVEVKEAPAK